MTGPNLPKVLHERGITTATFLPNLFLSPMYDFNNGFDFKDYPSLQNSPRIDNAKGRILCSLKKNMIVPILHKLYYCYEFLNPPVARGDKLTSDALNWLEKYKRNRFFLWIHYMDTHTPYSSFKNGWEKFNFKRHVSYATARYNLYSKSNDMTTSLLDLFRLY